MDTNRHESSESGEKLLLKEEVYQIVGCAMEVLNGLGHGQMLNYLRISSLRVGVIVNFKHAKLEWERIVL